MDVQVPGMVYATVQRSPVFGGEIAQIDDSAARSLPGVIDVVRVGGKKGEDGSRGNRILVSLLLLLQKATGKQNRVWRRWL